MAGSRKGGSGPSRPLSGVLFVVLGLVAAFGVSALAGFWDEEPAPTGLRALARGAADPASVRVEVLNGAGVSGLARDATYRLRDAGFDVVFFGNAGRFDHERSVALARAGELDRARAVAAALGIDSVALAPDSTLMLEVTVVLGDDWPPAAVAERGLVERLRDLLGRDTTPDSDPATGVRTRVDSAGQ